MRNTCKSDVKLCSCDSVFVIIYFKTMYDKTIFLLLDSAFVIITWNNLEKSLVYFKYRKINLISLLFINLLLWHPAISSLNRNTGPFLQTLAEKGLGKNE